MRSHLLLQSRAARSAECPATHSGKRTVSIAKQCVATRKSVDSTQPAAVSSSRPVCHWLGHLFIIAFVSVCVFVCVFAFACNSQPSIQPQIVSKQTKIDHLSWCTDEQRPRRVPRAMKTSFQPKWELLPSLLQQRRYKMMYTASTTTTTMKPMFSSIFFSSAAANGVLFSFVHNT